jgi:hypothetical protein
MNVSLAHCFPKAVGQKTGQFQPFSAHAPHLAGYLAAWRHAARLWLIPRKLCASLAGSA